MQQNDIIITDPKNTTWVWLLILSCILTLNYSRSSALIFCEAYQWLKLLKNKIHNNASIEELHDLDEDIFVCLYTCCLEFKNHFLKIILQDPFIIYIKTRLCILKPSLKVFKNPLKIFTCSNFYFFKFCFIPASCSFLCNYLTKEKENKVHMFK